MDLQYLLSETTENLQKEEAEEIDIISTTLNQWNRKTTEHSDFFAMISCIIYASESFKHLLLS